MPLETGIAIHKAEKDDIFVAAVTWFKHRIPNFPQRGLTLPYMKENMPSIVVIRGAGVQQAVNTACNRTIEILLVKKHIIPHNPPLVGLIVRPALRREHFVLPHRVTTTHWLLTAAKRALQDWLRGER